MTEADLNKIIPSAQSLRETTFGFSDKLIKAKDTIVRLKRNPSPEQVKDIRDAAERMVNAALGLRRAAETLE